MQTAGSGVAHSEHNLNTEKPLRFIQIWINTRQYGLRPNYGSFIGDSAGRSNHWAHLVSDVKGSVNTPIKINQDANIHVAELSSGNTIDFHLQEGRQAYLLCVEGKVKVSGQRGEDFLERHDAAEIYGENHFQVTPDGDQQTGHVLLVEMAFTGKGRSDL